MVRSSIRAPNTPLASPFQTEFLTHEAGHPLDQVVRSHFRRCEMYASPMKKNNSWCIVVADDHGPEYVPIRGAASNRPVQYCCFGRPTTLLQRALHRAQQVAPTGQIVVTVREEERARWEPALWFIRPERRFIS